MQFNCAPYKNNYSLMTVLFRAHGCRAIYRSLLDLRSAFTAEIKIYYGAVLNFQFQYKHSKMKVDPATEGKNQ